MFSKTRSEEGQASGFTRGRGLARHPSGTVCIPGPWPRDAGPLPGPSPLAGLKALLFYIPADFQTKGPALCFILGPALFFLKRI